MGGPGHAFRKTTTAALKLTHSSTPLHSCRLRFHRPEWFSSALQSLRQIPRPPSARRRIPLLGTAKQQVRPLPEPHATTKCHNTRALVQKTADPMPAARHATARSRRGLAPARLHAGFHRATSSVSAITKAAGPSSSPSTTSRLPSKRLIAVRRNQRHSGPYGTLTGVACRELGSRMKPMASI